MQIRIPVFLVFSLAAFSFAEDGYKKSYRNEGYQNRYSDGTTQSGQARAKRDVSLSDSANSTSVDENYARQHRYEIDSAQGRTSGMFQNGGRAERQYFHFGDAKTKQRIQMFETDRIGVLSEVDALYTRAEKCRTILQENPSFTREERRQFEREMALIDYEIAQIAKRIGSHDFNFSHPDEGSAQIKAIKATQFDTRWTLSPGRYQETFAKSLKRDNDWQLAYLKEVQSSLNTPFAEQKPKDNWDRIGEIKAMQEEIRRAQATLRR